MKLNDINENHVKSIEISRAWTPLLLISKMTEAEINKWKEESNEALKKQEIPFKVVNSKVYNSLIFFTAMFFLCILILSGLFLYMVNDNKFKSENSVQINPLFNATVDTKNQYSFQPNTENRYNFTIINKIYPNCSG